MCKYILHSITHNAPFPPAPFHICINLSFNLDLSAEGRRGPNTSAEAEAGGDTCDCLLVLQKVPSEGS